MKFMGFLGPVMLMAVGVIDAEIPRPPPLLLTSVENGTEPQDKFDCSGTIHGYVVLSQAFSGPHTLEGIWIGPHGTVVRHSRDELVFAAPGQRTAEVWLRFTKEGYLWNPLSVQSLEDEDRAAYDGSWKVNILWDGIEVAQSRFQMHCSEL